MKRNEQPELTYQLHATQAADGKSIPVAPRDLERWLADLPLLNTDQLAQTIPQYVQQLNQVEIPDKYRLQMLEILRPVVDHIYQALTKRVRGAHLDLSAEFQQTQWQLNVLLGEMASGYQRLLLYKARQAPGWFSAKSYAMLAERVGYYLSERILLAYQFCSVVPNRVWLDLNSTWRYVQHFRLAEKRVRDEMAFYPAQTGTMATIYKRMLLLSMVSPYSLRSAELEQIYFGLEPWVNDIKLLKVDETAQKGFYISLTADQGARFLEAGAITDDDLYIDTADLLKKLTLWKETGTAPESAKYKGMSDKLLQELIAKLNGALQRQSERIANPGEQVEVVIGLHNIDTLLQTLQLTFYQDILFPVAEEEPEEAISIIHDWEHYEAEFRQHDRLAGQQTEKTPQPVLQAGQDVKRHLFTVVDESETGVCLRCQGLEGEGLFIGQLLLMRGAAVNKWTLGAVRWMCHDNGRLKVGLYLLSAEVERVEVQRLDDGQQAENMTALKLKQEQGGDSLLLPRTEFRTGDELKLVQGDEHVEIVLGDIIWHSEGYAQFGYQSR